MAGHSHWAGIKHKKAAVDKKRAKFFSRFSKAIMVAAREGGGDPDKNLKLRYAVDKAKAGNMPNDSIDRAIKKATGELGDQVFEEIIYEGYGPNGVAIMVETLTNNRNRTAPEMRNIFSKHGGNLGTQGSVSFGFDHRGLITVPKAQVGFDDLFEAAAEAGADDVQDIEDAEEFVITTELPAFEPVKRALQEKGWALSTAEMAWIPQNDVSVGGKEAERVEALLSALEDNEDVQGVHSNFVPEDGAGSEG
jgi:YebC/PmpR family DNA-binding regulatory protein